MAKKINLGKVGITTEGAYDSSKAYEKLSCVTYNHESWVSTKDVPAGNAPDNASPFWQKMSARGEQGIQGPVGPQGNSAFDGNGVEIVNNLTQGGEAAVLSAEQGKILKKDLTELAREVIYDVSANNDGATFASLSALLSTENLSTLIPSTVRCGGMSIRFVQSSDNKYVQARCTAQNFTTDTTQWQVVDDVPTTGSDNLVKSGGVRNFIVNSVNSEKERAELAEQVLQDNIDDIKDETLEENRQMVNSIMENYAPVEITGDVNNAADEEDLTSVSVEGTDVLKFKDKVYNPLVYSGLGRKILRKNIVNGVNTLTQSMINQANTIYVIQYDFTLGEDITVPANCVLEFDGGSIKNGTIVGNETEIISNSTCFSDVVLAGDFSNTEVYAKWFSFGNDRVKNGLLFANLVSLGKLVYFEARSYYLTLDETVFERGTTIKGVGKELTTLYLIPSDNSNRFILGLSYNCGIRDMTIRYIGSNIPIDVIRVDRWFGMDTSAWNINIKNILINFDGGGSYTGVDVLKPVGIHWIHMIEDTYNGKYIIDRKGVVHQPATGSSYKSSIDGVDIWLFRFGVQITFNTGGPESENYLWINSIVFRNMVIECANGFFFDNRTPDKGSITRFSIEHCLYNQVDGCYVSVPSIPEPQSGIGIIGYCTNLQLFGFNVYDTINKYIIDGSIYDYGSIVAGVAPVNYKNSFTLPYTVNGKIQIYYEDEKKNNVILTLGNYNDNKKYRAAILSGNEGISEVVNYPEDVDPYEFECRRNFYYFDDTYMEYLYNKDYMYVKEYKNSEEEKLINIDYKYPVNLNTSNAKYSTLISSLHNKTKIIHGSDAEYGWSSIFDTPNINYIIFGNININSNVAFPSRAHIIFIGGTITNTNSGNDSNVEINLNNAYLEGDWETAFVGDITLTEKSNKHCSCVDTQMTNAIKPGAIVYDINYQRPMVRNDNGWSDADGYTYASKKGVDRPQGLDSYEDRGYSFYDFGTHKTVFWNGTRWVEIDGAAADTLRHGTFNNKPDSDDIYVGFRYFCTDRKVDMNSSSPTYMQVITPVSPDTGGMEILYKGSDIWVDALGRVVS